MSFTPPTHIFSPARWPIIQKWASWLVRLPPSTHFWIHTIENILREQTAVVRIIHPFDIEWPKRVFFSPFILLANIKNIEWKPTVNVLQTLDYLIEKCSNGLKKCFCVCCCACRSHVAAQTQTAGREGGAGTPQVQTRMGLESVLRHWGVHGTWPGAGGQGEYNQTTAVIKHFSINFWNMISILITI